MYDKLKAIATDQGWVFKYARKDFQNLVNEVEGDQTFLFLDPVQIGHDFGEFGEAQDKVYSGSFMLLKSSELDEGYEQRYLTDIKPLIESQLLIIQEAFACSDYTIDSWNTTEIINLFDYGYDGIVVSYSVSI